MYVKTFLKGVLMGTCDLVPGISGGTIAFISGIYERLIISVSRILSYLFLKEFIHAVFIYVSKPNKKNFSKVRKIFSSYDIGFLFTLILGILTAIILGSSVILILLEGYFVLTMSFFIGLIIASSLLIYKKIENHKVKDRLFGLLGFLVGISFLFLPLAQMNVNLFIVFLSGFIGICAMFLPGISGSYLLYLMGTYVFILEAVRNFYSDVLIVFLVGAVFGAIVVSRLIRFFLKRYHSQTLYVLFGFVLGALCIPLRDVFVMGFNGIEPVLAILLFFIGAFLVYIINPVTFKRLFQQ